MCLKCNEESHGAILCKYAEKWRNELEKDNLTLNYLKQHTKLCPDCKIPC